MITAAIAPLFALSLALVEEPVVPAGSAGAQKPASGGATEIEGQGKFATVTVPPEDEAAKQDVTELTVTSGGLLSTGNARAGAITGAANFRLRRERHQVGAIFVGNYGAAALSQEAGYDVNVANIQGRARYDVFISDRWSAFLMATGRNDRFQGLKFRLNVDPGIAFYILTQKNHRLWTELGYDLQYDLRTDDAIIQKDANGDPVLNADGQTIQVSDRSQVVHAARLFAGYSNRLTEKVSFDTGVEYLQSILEGKTFRLNWDNAVSTQLWGRLSLAVTFTLRYENNPLPAVRRLDTITAMNLVFRLL
jgi:putative salt-induced outer membrane protein